MMLTFAIITFSIDHVLLALLLVILYGAIAITFRKRCQSEAMAQSRVIDKASTELTKTAIVVTVIFMLTMTLPYWNFFLRYVGGHKFIVNDTLAMTGYWLNSLNSSANPFVYALLMPSYLKCVKKTFCGRCEPVK